MAVGRHAAILRAWINHRSGVSKKLKITGTLPTLADLSARY